jgi:membrane-associated phospholipid phosphatase
MADTGCREAIAGGILVGLTALVGLYFRARPGETFLDRWGASLLHPAHAHSRWSLVADLRSVPFLVGGSILAALVVVSRDRWRAFACLVAPTLAVLLTEYVLKPVVGRRLAEVLSFPSGTTTVVGSIAMVWILAVPARIRPAIVIVSTFVVALECMAVVALQWHFPTDALGGAVFGAGVVLLVDGLLHLAVVAVRRRILSTSEPGISSATS